MKKTENILGFIVILLVLVLGKGFLKTDLLFFRLLIGVGLGYALARAYTGFAGSVNRAYRTGSTKLMRTMMFMFFITALITSAFLFKSDPVNYNLWINPINMGLILGGFLFGFGMSISVCCASGVLTDLSAGFPRAFITLLFFCLGVFLGFPVQRTASWVRNSWFITPTGVRINEGVFLPDLFQWDGLGGYLGSLILLALFCAVVIFVSYYYEKKLKENDKYLGHGMEIQQEQITELELKNFKPFSAETYEHIFAKPWTLKQGAVVMSIIFTLLMGVTRAGWGASTPYGIWLGKVLMFLGISAESLADFTKMSADVFKLPFFQHEVSVQNFGIIVGAVIYLLTAGKFKAIFTSELKISKKEILLYALGGITMGLGTRFANGCNVGALYTPIANFSLSGWVFLVFMIVGGIISNRIFFSPPLTSSGNLKKQGSEISM
ncbi:YeeE/YedE family protein [Iocasia frigidifontis]|uniref:YeeE/YedE family protein n=1 Tax=Iocasia fonsfrigidae TaxID=2682810 RepID=A0A8A7KCG6_9FIRM|nr:YeeE/YedE family protein [Iocasia fonsfrigidae]QTL98940.1 YeeE/YedE family protein [Iocasia fonsfrigidae]